MTPLRQRMSEDMQVRNLSPRTQATYILQVSLFARHFHRSPEALGPEEIRAYQVFLINQKKLAPNSVSLAVAALRFLYRITLKKEWTFEEVIPAPKKPQKLPVILSPKEVLRFLACVQNVKQGAILTTSIAWSPVADSRPMLIDGSLAVPDSSCLFECWDAFFVACFCSIWRKPLIPANCSSSRPSSRSETGTSSGATWLRPTRPNGSSTPSRPSLDRNPCWLTSDATPTVSPSPIIACSRWRMAGSASVGRTIATTTTRR